MNPKVKSLIEKDYADQKSEKWLELRGTMLTASDAATAIGDNPYQKPRDLILSKCDAVPKFCGNEATRWGERFEDEARDKYCELRGEISHEIGCVQHPKYPFLGGSPDGVCESGMLIEIKCPMRREIVPGEVPSHYLPQIQLLMDILDLEECDFIQYKPAELTFPLPEEFTIVNIKRDRDWFSHYLPIMRDFWDKVLHHRKHGCGDIMPKKRTTKPRKRREITVEEEEVCLISVPESEIYLGG